MNGGNVRLLFGCSRITSFGRKGHHASLACNILLHLQLLYFHLYFQFLGCDRSGNLCNCDTNDDIWRKDDGILNDKATLPVSQLRIGDTGGTDEAALYHLGSLRCKGIGKSNTFWYSIIWYLELYMIWQFSQRKANERKVAHCISNLYHCISSSWTFNDTHMTTQNSSPLTWYTPKWVESSK